MKRIGRLGFGWKLLLILAAMIVLFNLILALGQVSDSGAATRLTRPSRGVVVDTYGSTLQRSVRPGCMGRVWHRQTIWIPLLHRAFAWRQTSVDRYCWTRRGVITVHEGDGYDGQWSMLGYCWSNTGHGDKAQNASGTERQAYNTGTLQVCGHISGQRTLTPRIYYKGPTSTRPHPSWNYGAGKPQLP